MKSLLNRRSVLAGPSHLVQVPRERSTESTSAPAPEDAALSQAAAGAAAADPYGAGFTASSEAARPVTTLRPVPAVPTQVSARGVQIADTVDVEWLAEEEALTPFHVFRSFEYSVSLLFHAKELAYYIVMYQDGSLWRALRAHDLEAAEAAFRHFEEQATRLSEGEARRAQLEAQNEQLARMIARSEAQAERLRNELQRRGAYEQAVTNRQHHVRKEVSQLEAQRVAAQAHLNKAQRQIHQLNLTTNEAIPHLPGR
ncbi:DUF2968 domain-containing protein [Paraburkholderia sp. PREW-6R]|uniref:DUF2968 domain-containing protein n=1 Tax=Paraburkholderia sp. PREW-6R TaxID=3141544 RepID=UPI0031F5D8E3